MPQTKEQKKIKTISELSQLANEHKKSGHKVVLCHGVFDLIHPGHIKHIEAAKKKGDILIVTVTPDRYVNKGPGRPVFGELLRAESIAALKPVDYVGVNEWETATETIRHIKPSFYVKGSDYSAPKQDITGGIIEEKEAVEEVGGRIHFTDEITFSSTELLNKFFGVFTKEVQHFLENFKKKHSSDDVVNRLKKLSKMKVLVIGDVIIDEYHYCKGMGKPSKDNVISAKYINEERFAGGVLACANHVAGFCNDVTLVTSLGTQDSKEKYIKAHLKKNVKTKFFHRDDTCTTVKRRFVDPVFLTKLFEVSYFDDHELPKKISDEVVKYLNSEIKKYDLVLVSDFGHGFINSDIIDLLSKKAKFLAVNTQTNSANMGYNIITKYPRADYVCIDEPEVRLSVQNRYGDLKNIIKIIAKKVKAQKISITCGHLGSLTYDSKKGFFETKPFSNKIVDRIGAGDAYLSITSPLVASQAPMDVVGFVGNAVAAIKIGIVCNRSSIEPIPLYKFIGTLLK
jgi:rfaE bifunctional protein nucleotidyltransferase chain/domain